MYVILLDKTTIQPDARRAMQTLVRVPAIRGRTGGREHYITGTKT